MAARVVSSIGYAEASPSVSGQHCERERVLIFRRKRLRFSDRLLKELGHQQRIARLPQKVRGLGVSRGLSTEGAVPGLHPNRIRNVDALSRVGEGKQPHVV